MKRATIAIAGGNPEHLAPGTPVVSPLVQSVNFIQEAGTGEGLLYARTGGTESLKLLESRIAMLEGAEDAAILGSGMSAISCTMLTLLRPGDHIVSSAWIYGGAHKLFTEELRALNIDVTFVVPTEPENWSAAVKPNTRLLFIESPINPTSRVLDVAPIVEVAKKNGLVTVIDATFAGPINYRPIDAGIDVVIHSATKSLNGHHDVLAGVVCGTKDFVLEIKKKLGNWGFSADPFACWLLERGLKTLDVRVKRQNENAMKLAEWCLTRPEFSTVFYPGLPTHPDHEIAERTLEGFGGMLFLTMNGGGKAATKFTKRLRLAMNAASLGGVDTLVSEPRFMSHGYLTQEEREEMGIPDGSIRVSIGLEDIDDIISDFSQALTNLV